MPRRENRKSNEIKAKEMRHVFGEANQMKGLSFIGCVKPCVVDVTTTDFDKVTNCSTKPSVESGKGRENEGEKMQEIKKKVTHKYTQKCIGEDFRSFGIRCLLEFQKGIFVCLFVCNVNDFLSFTDF